MEKLVPKLRFPEFDGNWEINQLGKVTEINPKNGILPDNFIYIDLESVNNGILEKENYISKETAPSRAQRILKKDDILYQTVRPYQKNNLYFDKGTGNYIASTGYAQLRTKNNSKFLYQFLHTDKFVSRVLLHCTGTSYPSINSSDLSEIQISLPKPEEQQKIASFLTSVDERLTLLAQQKEKLELYKKGVMQQIFSQKLRFKDENGNNYPDWEEKKLGEIGKFYAGGDLDKLKYSKLKNDEFVYPIYANGAGEGIYGYATTYQYKSNSVTVSGRGNLGFAKVREQKFNAIVRLIVIEPNENIKPKFLEEIINQTKFAIESTGVPQLTVPQIKSYKINVPSLIEQQKIASFLSAIDVQIEGVSKKIEQTKLFKKGLLQQMFV
ncbi:restriction endonuclease subunit S [Flavobacterium cheniae]|uniref:Type I restriction enzyme S subunit n=1 Tax=Flavobacterium cheniae TaxID=295428 RepID=A0A562KCD5_9FLAO|nr:restriction endonuclease subunit S [Flavobacterium cheniae]TDR18633.1 type I restriction enzyme S subunit [Flavobacterium cheniae]TWH92885.1 type I restriction enzyme S subunit [Flavobacterium cheniae]